MKKNVRLLIKRILSFSGILLFFIVSPGLSFAAGPVIIDHNCTNIWQIPESAIVQAKANLHIAYGHTSHGSQLISGMGSSNGAQLDAFMTSNGATPNLYLWNHGGSDGALDLHDYAMGGDVGYYPQWENNTRAYLGASDPTTGRGSLHPHVNVIIWSWCGQVSGRTEQSMIETYLDPMGRLERDYPGITFVYMTGHLDGTGFLGNLHLRNEQIRAHCIANSKVLYDFADIESFDPDGIVNYNDLHANDNCDYDSDGNGSRDKNWATDWQDKHTVGVDWWVSGAAHSKDLNGNLKGYAAWWLWAKLGGWENGAQLPPNSPSNLDASAAPWERSIHLTWTDNSDNEESFILERKVDNGDFNVLATPDQNETSYSDIDLCPFCLYVYRIKAVNNYGESSYDLETSVYVFDDDGDVDGADLAAFVTAYNGECVKAFASFFGL